MEQTVDLLVFMFGLGELQLRVARDRHVTFGYFSQELFERMQVVAAKKLKGRSEIPPLDGGKRQEAMEWSVATGSFSGSPCAVLVLCKIDSRSGDTSLDPGETTELKDWKKFTLAH